MGKPAAHYCTPMLLHELAEIIGMDDVSFRPGSDERARLEPLRDAKAQHCCAAPMK